LSFDVLPKRQNGALSCDGGGVAKRAATKPRSLKCALAAQALFTPLGPSGAGCKQTVSGLKMQGRMGPEGRAVGGEDDFVVDAVHGRPVQGLLRRQAPPSDRGRPAMTAAAPNLSRTVVRP